MTQFLEEMMRPLAAIFALCLFTSCVFAQQAESSNPPSAKKSANKTQPVKTAETTAKPTEPDAEPAKPAPGTAETDKDKEEHYDMTEVPPVITHHQITVNGKLLNYTATTGRLPIKRGDGKIEAEMFFVAYTLDGQQAAKRPLTFAFNGGPGSASVWLHMGVLGPRHVMMQQPEGFMPAAPYHIEDNPNTLLDKSDLVLVDAIGTGFSRAATPELFHKFWGVKGDIESFSEFIRLYLTRYERWVSPLFLLGESYGTTRAAGISGYLAGRGIAFNGITLLSIALSFETLEDTKTNDLPFPLLIPTFTMVAGYHHKLAPELEADMTKAREEAEHWAANDYTLALAKGDALTPEERQKIIDEMSRLTGLSKEVIDEANLRINVEKFTHYLLLDRKLRVGRLDGRFTGPDPQGPLDTRFYDPTEPAILPPYTSVFNNYVRTELGYESDMPYYVFADNAGLEKWDWGPAGRGFPDTATALREAMVENPYLKVLVLEGHYDLATPYFAAEYTMDHLDLSPKYRANISFGFFEAGHMVYLPAEGQKKMKEDVAGFMQKAEGQ